jgi:hypothetical protein
MNLEESEAKNVCPGEGQQQFNWQTDQEACRQDELIGCKPPVVK